MNQTVTVRNMFDTVPVLEQIAAGKSLRQVAEQFGISSPSRITELAASDPTFALQYARAQELRADIHADRIETVAAELLDGSRTDSQAARVAIDALKWVLATRNEIANVVALVGAESCEWSPVPNSWFQS